jgi:hypothetical protein
VNRKAGIAPLISNAVPITGTPLGYASSTTGFSWTGGTPNTAVTDTHTGIYVWNVDNGFKLSVPASTTKQMLTLYVGVWRAQGQLSLSLSDGSASDLLDANLVNHTASTNGIYTIDFRAPTAGQTLNVKFTQLDTGTTGNVTLQAATLSQ